MVSKSTNFVSHSGWISANYYDVIKDEFYKDIRRNFTFVNIEVVPLLAKVKGFLL